MAAKFEKLKCENFYIFLHLTPSTWLYEVCITIEPCSELHVKLFERRKIKISNKLGFPKKKNFFNLVKNRKNEKCATAKALYEIQNIFFL